MKIDKKLNIVIAVAGGLVHSAPISRQIFERYFLSISKAFSEIYSGGLGYVSGPRVAALLLKKIAIDIGDWEGKDGVENGLMNEIYRLSNMVITGENGWSTIPLYDAIRQDMLTEDEKAEVDNALVFFICASAMHRQTDLSAVLSGMGALWGGQITSLDCTEFAASLRISTPTDNSGAKVTASSIPS